MASEYNDTEQADFDRALSGSVDSTTSDTPVKVNDAKNQTDTYGQSDMFGIRSIQYPADIDVSDAGGYQRHFIRFTINVDEESRIIKRDKVAATDVDNSGQNRFRTGNTSQELFNAGGAVVGGAIVAGSSVVGKLIGSQKNFKGKAIAGALAFGTGAVIGSAVASQFNVTKKLKKLASSITLYNPGNITAGYNFSYQATDDMTNDLLQNDRGSELVRDSKTGELAPVDAAVKTAKILATAGSELIQGLTRTTRNPKKDMLFKEVSSRQFQFDYVFQPKSALEAYDIANIIYMFKFFAHPEMLEGFDQFLYIYPAEFDIEYVFKAGGAETPNMYLNKISSCVLEGIDINYGPNGSFQSLASGEPVLTTMSLRFKEIETLHQDRIAKGY